MEEAGRRFSPSRESALKDKRRAALPLGDGLWIDAVALCQAPYALLTMLYCTTDRRGRAGEPYDSPN